MKKEKAKNFYFLTSGKVVFESAFQSRSNDLRFTVILKLRFAGSTGPMVKYGRVLTSAGFVRRSEGYHVSWSMTPPALTLQPSAKLSFFANFKKNSLKCYPLTILPVPKPSPTSQLKKILQHLEKITIFCIFIYRLHSVIIL